MFISRMHLTIPLIILYLNCDQCQNTCAGGVSGVALMPSLAAGAAAQGLTRQHRSAEGALTTTRSLVRRVRDTYDLWLYCIEHIFNI